MRHHWLHHNNKKKLIVFFCGWGQDPKPFAPLGTENYDVLMLYNYQSIALPVDIKSISVAYESCELIAWSMGVMLANIVCADISEIFSHKLAISGSLSPVDDQFGIPPKQYIGTMKLFSEKVRDAFFQNMNLDAEIINTFNRNKPERSVEDQKKELEFLFSTARKYGHESNIFEKALICGRDRIFPVENLMAFWGEKAEKIDPPHFLFYKFKSWDELISGKPHKTQQYT